MLGMTVALVAVILDSASVRRSRATLFVNGKLITYEYPTGLLKRTKNLVFDDGGSELFP